MKRLRRKLHSSRGSSMILALALMLVCVMISSIILAAAASGSSRNAYRDEQQKAYLAISSATDLIMKDLESMQALQNPTTLVDEPLIFVGHYERKHYGCLDCTIVATMNYSGMELTGTRLEAAFAPIVEGREESGHLIFDDPNAHIGQEILNGKLIHTDSGAIRTMDIAATTDASVFSNTIFGEMMIDAAEYVYTKGISYTENFEITMNETVVSGQRLPKVIATFSMDVNYDVEIKVTAEDSSQTVLITMEANEIALLDADEAETEDEFTCTHRIYYTYYDTVSGAYIETVEECAIPGNKEVLNTSITWNLPIVAKGVTS